MSLLRSRRGGAVGLLVVALALVACAAGTWVRASASTALGESVVVAVSGNDAAPGVTAAALLLAACGAAAGLSGPVARRVVGVVAAGGAVLAVLGAVGVLRDPGPAAVGAAADLTGLRAAAGSAVLGTASITAVPWLAAVVAGLALVPAAVLLTGRTTARARSRFERDEGSSSVRVSADARQAGASQRDQAAERGTGTVAGAVALWDAIGHGQDPTADDAPADEPDARSVAEVDQ